MLQAFIDESTEENGPFVLGGCIASTESWAAFSLEWERLLPRFGILREGDCRYHFKMKEMAALEERMARVPVFYRVIESHIIGFVSARIDTSDLKRAISRIVMRDTKIDWGTYRNPYYITFRCLVDMFHTHRGLMTDAIPLDEKIDFYFDEQITEKKPILEMWDNYIRARPDATRRFYGVTPVFRDDMVFLPLQAADFWAWWVRKWCADGTPEKIRTGDFGIPMGERKRKLLRVDLSYNEDQLVESLTKTLLGQVGPDHKSIYDAKVY